MSAQKDEDIVSPLKGLSAVQEKAVIDLLKGLPENPNKKGYVYLSQLTQFLTALKSLGILDDSDPYKLRRWVEKETQLQVPSMREFNESYPNTTIRKVNTAKEKIRKAIEKVR